MNVLVTGAAGFLGSHLVDAYLAAGAAVAGIDNFATSTGENIAHLAQDTHFRFVEADVGKPLPNIACRPDLILHFASPASPVDYACDPIGTLLVNSVGTEACCKLAADHGARLLIASTSEVYGDPLVHPQPEEYWGNVNPTGERSCYDEGKRFAEAMVCAYRRAYGIDARIARIFNTYGPRMRADDGRVVPSFIKQAMSGEPLTIFGQGAQTRSLCYVADLVDALGRFAVIEAPQHTIVNLGAEHEVSVNEIARTVARLCRVPLRTERRPLPADDPARRRPDLTRARAMLGWEPRTSLESGLRETIEWFRAPLQLEKETASS